MEKMAEIDENSIFVGLDIGTTKIAMIIMDIHQKILCVSSVPHFSEKTEFHSLGHFEQDPGAILKVCEEMIKSICSVIKHRIRAIGITGQMHGIVVLDSLQNPVTNLITWQDQRCNEKPDFLKSINTSCKTELSTGFGCATLAWLIAQKELPETANFCCTVHDMLVGRLLGVSRPCIDASMAASWGLYDFETGNWNFEALKKCNIPLSLLPTIAKCGEKAGNLCKAMAQTLELPENIPIFNAIGDTQASIIGSLKDFKTELALTIGTGIQVSIVVEKPLKKDTSNKFENRPFIDNTVALIAAPMCGGAAWGWLADFIQNTLNSLGIPEFSKEKIFYLMNTEGLKSESELEVLPHFLGERYDNSLKGSILGITLANTSFGSLARGLARGIIKNLKEMLPPEILDNRSQIIASGNAIRRNTLLQHMVEEEFDLPLVIPESAEEAAKGAAINAMRKTK